MDNVVFLPGLQLLFFGQFAYLRFLGTTKNFPGFYERLFLLLGKSASGAMWLLERKQETVLTQPGMVILVVHCVLITFLFILIWGRGWLVG